MSEIYFKDAIKIEFLDLIKTDRYFCKELWSALTNTDWFDADGKPAIGIFEFTFRSAGRFIAGLRGEGCYLDWYCESPPGVVSERISSTLSKYGFTHKEITYND